MVPDNSVHIVVRRVPSTFSHNFPLCRGGWTEEINQFRPMLVGFGVEFALNLRCIDEVTGYTYELYVTFVCACDNFIEIYSRAIFAFSRVRFRPASIMMM